MTDGKDQPAQGAQMLPSDGLPVDVDGPPATDGRMMPGLFIGDISGPVVRLDKIFRIKKETKS